MRRRDEALDRLVEMGAIAPAVQQRADEQERDAHGDCKVCEVERDSTAQQRVRHAVAPAEPAHERRERATARKAGAERDRPRAETRRERQQRAGESEGACIDDRRALVREEARLQDVVDDGRDDDRERSGER